LAVTVTCTCSNGGGNSGSGGSGGALNAITLINNGCAVAQVTTPIATGGTPVVSAIA